MLASGAIADLDNWHILGPSPRDAIEMTGSCRDARCALRDGIQRSDGSTPIDSMNASSSLFACSSTLLDSR